MAEGPCSASSVGGKLDSPMSPHIKNTKQKKEENRVHAMYSAYNYLI